MKKISIIEIQEDKKFLNAQVSKIYHIKESICKQEKLLWAIKMTTKEHKLTNKYFQSLKYTVQKMNERFEYLINFVIPSYLKLTPLHDFIRNLELNGESFHTYLEEHLDLENLNNSTTNYLENDEKVNKFVDKIIKNKNISENYKNQILDYKKFLTKRNEKIQVEINERKKKLHNIKENEAMNVLKLHVNQFQRSLENRDGNYVSSYILKSLDKQLEFFKQNKISDFKLIFFVKTQKGKAGKVQCYSKENMIEPYLTKMKVMTLNENIDSKIQKLIDEKQVVFQEIIMPCCLC